MASPRGKELTSAASVLPDVSPRYFCKRESPGETSRGSKQRADVAARAEKGELMFARDTSVNGLNMHLDESLSSVERPRHFNDPTLFPPGEKTEKRSVSERVSGHGSLPVDRSQTFSCS